MAIKPQREYFITVRTEKDPYGKSVNNFEYSHDRSYVQGQVDALNAVFINTNSGFVAELRVL